MSYSLVVFDWDGTLMDSVPRIVTAMQRAAEDLGLAAFEAEQVRHIVGLGLPEAIAELAPQLDAQQAERLRQLYIERFAELVANSPLDMFFEGIEELLARLAQADTRLAIATGKGMPGLQRALALHPAQQGLFSALKTADLTRSKPHPLMLEQLLAETGVAPAEAVMIGDSIYDMQMARRAGLDGIGVAWGVHGVAQLLENGAARVARTPRQLSDWLVASGSQVER